MLSSLPVSSYDDLSRTKRNGLGSRPKYSETDDVRALVQAPLDRWRRGACFMCRAHFDDVSSF